MGNIVIKRKKKFKQRHKLIQNFKLIEAIKQQNAAKIQKLLECGVDVNFGSQFHMTAIHYAVLWSGPNTDIIALLLRFGADVNCKDNNGITPLMLASFFNLVETSRLLIENGADVSIRKTGGTTPLHLAVLKDSIDLAKLLLEHGANVNETDDSNMRPIDFAIMKNKINIAKFLIDNGADITEFITKPLKVAINSNLIHVITMLLDNGINVNEENKYESTVLEHAINVGNELIVKLLLVHGANINCVNYDNIRLRMSPNRDAIERMLIRHIIHFKALGLYINKKSEDYMMKRMNTYFKKLRIESENEVKRLKIHIVSRRHKFTWYHLLTEPVNKLVPFFQNNKVRRIVQKSYHSWEYPIYCDLIGTRLDIIRFYAKLLQDCSRLLQLIFKSVYCPLPVTCISQILTYFSEKDLKFLVAVFNSPVYS